MGERERITLVCSECEARNYRTTRAPRKADSGTAKGEPGKRLELKKFCPQCGKHTVHRESR